MISEEQMVAKLELSGCLVNYTGRHSYMCQCPAHDDGRPSLSLALDGDKWLVHCFAGCGFEEVCDALDIMPSEMFREPKQVSTLARLRKVASVDTATDDEVRMVVLMTPRNDAEKWEQRRYINIARQRGLIP